MQYILNKTSEIKFSVDRVYGLAIMNILPRSTTSKNIDKIHTTMYISWWFRFCWKILSSSTATLNLTQTLEKRALSAITLIGVRVWTNIYFEKINHLSINYPVSNTVQTFMPVCQYSLISFVLLHITLGFLAEISFTPLLYHPRGCFGCPEKQTSSRNYNLFVRSAVFQPNGMTFKKPTNIIKSSEKLLFFGIFSEFVQWLENSVPNQLDELKWIVLLLLTPKPSLAAE